MRDVELLKISLIEYLSNSLKESNKNFDRKMIADEISKFANTVFGYLEKEFGLIEKDNLNNIKIIEEKELPLFWLSFKKYNGPSWYPFLLDRTAKSSKEIGDYERGIFQAIITYQNSPENYIASIKEKSIKGTPDSSIKKNQTECLNEVKKVGIKKRTIRYLLAGTVIVIASIILVSYLIPPKIIKVYKPYKVVVLPFNNVSGNTDIGSIAFQGLQDKFSNSKYINICYYKDSLHLDLLDDVQLEEYRISQDAHLVIGGTYHEDSSYLILNISAKESPTLKREIYDPIYQKDIRTWNIRGKIDYLLNQVAGIIYYDKGEYEKAILFLREARSYSNHYYFFSRLIDSYEKLELYDSIIALSKPLLNAKDEVVQGYGYIMVGHSLFKKGEFEQSNNYILEGLQKDSTKYGLYFMAGRNYKSLGDYDIARIYLAKSISLKPILNAYRELSQIEIFQKNYDKSKQLCDSMLVIDSLCSLGYYQRGLSYFGQKKIEKAILDFKKAISIDSTSIYYYALGKSYEELNLIDDAIFNYKSAINKDSMYFEPHVRLASIYYEKADVDSCLPYVQKAVEFNPSTNYLHLILGECYFALGDTVNTRLNYNIVLNRDSSYPSLNWRMANLEFECGNKDLGLKYLAEAARDGVHDTSLVKLASHYNIKIEVDSIFTDTKSHQKFNPEMRQ